MSFDHIIGGHQREQIWNESGVAVSVTARPPGAASTPEHYMFVFQVHLAHSLREQLPLCIHIWCSINPSMLHGCVSKLTWHNQCITITAVYPHVVQHQPQNTVWLCFQTYLAQSMHKQLLLYLHVWCSVTPSTV